MCRTWLLMVTGIVEAATGLSLLILPSILLELLLGVSQPIPEALVIARVAGAALVAIGVACWLARNDRHSPAQTGLVTGMLIYNVVVAGVLAYSGAVLKLAGLVLWPAVALHLILAGWCVVGLKKRNES